MSTLKTPFLLRAIAASLVVMATMSADLSERKAHASGTTSASPAIGVTAPINAFTGNDILKGVWRKHAGISIPSTPARAAAFVPGASIRFADGQVRKITKVFVSGSNLSVYVEGALLDAHQVGAPNSVTTVASASAESATGIVARINQFTGADILNGIWRQSAGFSIPASAPSITAFTPGMLVRFADGQIRNITKVFRSGENLSVYVDGALLDGNKVGSPNTVSTVDAQSYVSPPVVAAMAPAFLAKGDIRGIDISPPVDNWSAPAYGMNPARLAAMTQAGYNTHRVFISLDEFLNPPISMDRTLAKWVEYVDKSVQAGFRVHVSWASEWDERIAVVNDAATRAKFNKALTSVCGALGSYFTERQVALEMINEPPDESLTPGLYSTASPAWFSTCRAAAPKMTIILQPEGGWHGALHKFKLSDYDWNTMFSFHPYSPGEFTHQGIGSQPHLYNVPMPITRYVGGKTQMIADMQHRVNSDKSLSSTRKTSEIARYTKLIDFLWWNNGSHWEDWSDLQRWVKTSGINPKRIIAGEFGVVSEFNFNGVRALPDVASRAHFLRKVKDQTEANQFAGWVVHQAFGDFNMFEQTAVGQHRDTLIPELVTALFTNKPLPEGPPVSASR